MISSVKAKNPEVPLFLRKTYHMIDTCDPAVACWSDDGETFVVKNTDVFEKQVIPQFFKHSKFASFVRQLNFYGFRKIKYNDTIKIDPKLEAETANFWRFRHEKFLKGRPELLGEIKRSNGSTVPATATPKPPVKVAQEDTGALKSEVTVLKQRIEDMSKNLNALTNLVQKVTLNEPTENSTGAGAKRKKVDAEMTLADATPDAALSSIDMDDFPVPSSLPPPLPSVQRRESSNGASSDLSDEDFVNELYSTFADDSLDGLLHDLPMPAASQLNGGTKGIENDEEDVDPALMKKLRDALKLLPREMQEMIVDRLVSAITNTESLEKNVSAASTLTECSRVTKSRPPIQNTGKVGPSSQVLPPPITTTAVEGSQAQLPMTLAAATLSAILTQYTKSVKEAHSSKAVAQKPLPPVVPVHA